MNFNQLKTVTTGFVAAFAFSALVISCNNDKSENNSTAGEASTDSTATAKMSDSSATVAKKRKARISAAIAADDQTVKIQVDKSGYYNRTEVAPAFAGGQSSLEDYINSKIEYPQDAIDNNVEGVVNVQFAVDEKGNVSNVTTVGNKLGYGLEEEAIKVVSQMPKWTPGQVKGKNVKTWRTLPINYRLES